MVLYIFLITALLLVFLIYWSTQSNYWQKRNVAYVKRATPFGIIWEFITGDRSLSEIYKDVYDKYNGEPHVGLFLGSKPALLLRDPKDIQAVLAGDFINFNSRGIVTNPNDLLSDSILFIDDYRRWKLIRQKLTPIFTAAKLKNWFPIIEHSAQDFVSFIEDHKELCKEPFKLIYTYTAASIGSSIFGIDTQVKNTMDSPFLDMAWKAVTPTYKSIIKFFIAGTFPILFKMLKLKLFGEYEEFFIGVVKNVMKERENEGNPIKRNDFIDLCLELQRKGTMRDEATDLELEPTSELLAAQAFFFFIAGVDTSANTMNFTLLELANNPEILLKVHKEIDDVFGSCNDQLLYESMDKLQYLDAVVNEAVRKYPPIGAIQRKCTNDTVLPVRNIKVEKDTIVVIPIFAIQRDERYYPNSELYDPERFQNHNLEGRKYTYLPFGEGNRICIGNRFARLQVKAGLAWLLRRFTLLPQSKKIDRFERSSFALRATDVTYDLVPRISPSYAVESGIYFPLNMA